MQTPSHRVDYEIQDLSAQIPVPSMGGQAWIYDVLMSAAPHRNTLRTQEVKQ